MSNLLDDPKFLADLKSDLSGRAVADKWPVSKSTVNEYRLRLARKDGLPTTEKVAAIKADAGYRFDVGTNGVVDVTTKPTEQPQTVTEAESLLRSKGIDPEFYTVSYGWSEWEQSTKDGSVRTLNAYRIRATPKPVADVAAEVDWSAASKFIEGFTYIPAKRDFLVDTAILQPTDEQWGKTDFNGGTPQTEERVLNSYSAFVDYCKEYRPRQAAFLHTGDGIENTCSTGSQRDTNDLDVPHQIVQSYQIDLQGLAMVAPHVQEIVSARVTSNHGRWRTGLKADAGNPHADFGIAVGRQLEHTQRILGVLPNVKFLFPDALMESMTVQLDTIRAGMTHGHLAQGPDKMGDWWSKQDHGRMPTWDADMLFVGHWHSLRIYQSGDGRWVVVGPASDNGSSWFSNLKGERARSGMLAMAIEGKRWRFQEIL